MTNTPSTWEERFETTIGPDFRSLLDLLNRGGFNKSDSLKAVSDHKDAVRKFIAQEREEVKREVENEPMTVEQYNRITHGFRESLKGEVIRMRDFDGHGKYEDEPRAKAYIQGQLNVIGKLLAALEGTNDEYHGKMEP